MLGSIMSGKPNPGLKVHEEIKGAEKWVGNNFYLELDWEGDSMAGKRFGKVKHLNGIQGPILQRTSKNHICMYVTSEERLVGN